MRITILVMLLLSITGGCAYIDQNLKVNSQANIVSSSIGAGKKVGLRVVDDRDEQLIGKRAGGYGIGMAKISTDQDLVEVLKGILVNGFEKKGFEIVEFEEADPSVRVELRSLDYDTAIGFWTGGNIGKAAIKVLATKANGKTYEQTYRGQKEIRTAFVGSQETNAKVINGAFDEAIEKFFTDEDFLNFLVK